MQPSYRDDAARRFRRSRVPADDAVAKARAQAKQLVAELAAAVLPARIGGWPNGCCQRRRHDRGQPDTLDLKIAAATVAEMTDAFEMFAPYHDSAEGDDLRLGAHARPTIRCTPRRTTSPRSSPRRAGWSSPAPVRGSCRPAMEGAGRERSIGVSIRLPFEQGANPVIAGDDEVRQHEVLLHPQADADQGEQRVHLPARRVRHARRDVRAAHADPDRQGHPGADRLPRHAGRPVLGDGRTSSSRRSSSRRGLVAPRDPGLYFVTDDVEAAVDEIVGFYRNYDSMRYVGDLLVHPPAPRADRRAARPAQRRVRPPVRRRAGSSASAPLDPEVARAMTAWSCRGSRSLRQARLRRPARADRHAERASSRRRRHPARMRRDDGRAIWRYPVKSMIGEQVPIGARARPRDGIVGDRAWATARRGARRHPRARRRSGS